MTTTNLPNAYESDELNSVATTFSKKLTSCIVTAVKDVFWGFIYSEKVLEEEREQGGIEDRQELTPGKEDVISILTPCMFGQKM